MISMETLKTIPMQCDTSRGSNFKTNLSSVAQSKNDFPNFPAMKMRTENVSALSETIEGETSNFVTDNGSELTTDSFKEKVMENYRRIRYPSREPSDSECNVTQADVFVKTKGEDEKGIITEELIIDDSFGLAVDNYEETEVERFIGLQGNVLCLLEEPTDFKQCDFSAHFLVIPEVEEESEPLRSELIDSIKIEADHEEIVAESENASLSSNFVGRGDSVRTESDNFEMVAHNESSLHENASLLSNFVGRGDSVRTESDNFEMVAHNESSLHENASLSSNFVGKGDSIRTESDSFEMVAHNESSLHENAFMSLNSSADVEQFDFSPNVLRLRAEAGQEGEGQTMFEFGGHFLSGFRDVESDGVEGSNASGVVKVARKAPVKVRQQQTSPKTSSKDITGKKPSNCPEYLWEFSSESCSDNRMNRHSEKRFKCQFCPEKFSVECKLKEHLMAHNNRRVFGCPHCTAGFNMWLNWVQHLKCHPVKKSLSLARYPCPLCQLEIQSDSYFMSHMKMHSREKPFKCNVCPLKFASEQSLNEHLSAHDNGRQETFFLCPHCSEKFSGKSKLSEHLKSHSLKAPAKKRQPGQKFKCKFCPEKFARDANLKYHLLAHDNNRQFKCLLCTASFNIKANLTRHSKLH